MSSVALDRLGVECEPEPIDWESPMVQAEYSAWLAKNEGNDFAERVRRELSSLALSLRSSQQRHEKESRECRDANLRDAWWYALGLGLAYKIGADEIERLIRILCPEDKVQPANGEPAPF